MYVWYYMDVKLHGCICKIRYLQGAYTRCVNLAARQMVLVWS